MRATPASSAFFMMISAMRPLPEAVTRGEESLPRCPGHFSAWDVWVAGKQRYVDIMFKPRWKIPRQVPG
ncbi:MAG: hypothetical protein HW380_2651 [Magnetococcales bacterium]|nr:hypothetical protein [Magnetococcales bacterium]